MRTMAESLGVAASVMIVLGFTSTVISMCHDYHAAANGAPWELIRLTKELGDLRSVLQGLEPIARQVDHA